jgi:probable phosphomutase (TIGR03848 family)
VTSPEPTLAPPPGADESAAAPAHRSTRIVLVRHAVTAETGSKLSGRAPGIDLSETGRGQAEQAGERLAPVPVAAVYASPIERTTQTAELIAKHHGIPVQPLPGVIEADYGEWTGEKLSDLMKLDLWKTVQVAPSRVRFPQGEAMVAMQARMVEAIEALAADHPGETIVVVSHADPIKAVVAHFTGLPLDLFQRIAVSPASVTVLELGQFGATLVKSNDTGSLDDLVPKTTTTSDSESGEPAPGSGGDDG